jgi:hypothetical protein
MLGICHFEAVFLYVSLFIIVLLLVAYVQGSAVRFNINPVVGVLIPTERIVDADSCVEIHFRFAHHTRWQFSQCTFHHCQMLDIVMRLKHRLARVVLEQHTSKRPDIDRLSPA